MVEEKGDKSGLQTLSNKKEAFPHLTSQNRVLILGSQIGGAYKIADAFQTYLENKGVESPVVQVLRDAGIIEQAVLYEKEEDKNKNKISPPKGIILLPEMRQYHEGMGMSLNTYKCGISDYVEDLCEKYNIPLVKIMEYKSPQQIEEGLTTILTSKPT